jgi:hypothetical protein
MLCVPNRLAGSGLSAELSEARECVCYLFLRSNENKFSEYEKSYLNCAVGLVSKCLGVSTVARRKYPENVEKLLQKTEIEKENALRLKESVEWSTKFCSQGFNSWSDFVQGIERVGNSVIFHPQCVPVLKSLFTIECFIWQPGLRSDINEYVRSSFDSIRGSLENDATAHRVLASGRSQRNGNVMWIPLKLSTGNTVALLYLEKKIDLRQGTFDFARQKSDDVGIEENKRGGISSETFLSEQILESITNEELIFSEFDEEVMNYFAILATGTLDRFVHEKETLQSIQTASKAILALQQSQAKLEHAMAIEVAEKLKLEETIKIGSEILAPALIQR